tara:strand:+ start:105 stop:437 length:333 start_codon:yes stop_codon:yes gene_type:complete
MATLNDINDISMADIGPAPEFNFEGKMHLRIAFGILLLLPPVMFVAGFTTLTGITGLSGILLGLAAYLTASISFGYVVKQLFLEGVCDYIIWVVKGIRRDVEKSFMRSIQ